MIHFMIRVLSIASVLSFAGAALAQDHTSAPAAPAAERSHARRMALLITSWLRTNLKT